MTETFKTSVRRVGTSLGVLIPKEVATREHLKEGEEVEIGIMKKRKLRVIEESFGIAGGAGPFQREKKDRGF